MADIAIFRINYKSDFILTLQSNAGWLTPFCIKFWTGAPSKAYYAYYDGMSYTHCTPVEGDPTKLLVQFDDHHLPVGNLKYQIGYHFTVADFPTSVEDEVLNQAAVIIDNDGNPAQVMLDFNGETAPEIEFSLPAYANEAQRIANEQARIAAEEQRIANEQARISAEETRQANEQQRINAEAERVNEFAVLKTKSEAATAAANIAATLANEKAQLADDKAALAQSAATLANAKAQLAADKAALAQSAATLANDKAQLAADKAALAQQKAEYAQTQGNYAKAQGDAAHALNEEVRQDEDARKEAEQTREQQETARQEAEAQRVTDFNTQMQQQQTAYTEAEAARQTAFNEAETERDAKVDAKVADITNMQAQLGYFVCDTGASVAAKTIAAAGYVLTTGGNIRIKMTNANTADAATLNINSTGAKALFYNGTQASSTNSWEAGEVVEVYYDGTNYQASNTIGGGNLSIIHEIDTTTEYTDKDVAGADVVQVALDELINDEETLAKALIDLNNNKANKEELPDMEELELVTATALTDLKGREIPNAFVQKITLDKLVEDGAYYVNGLLTADGSIYGASNVGIHYIFANNNYNKIYAKTQVRSNTTPGNGVIVFYSSSNDISVQSFISSIQVSAFGILVEYYANVPANTKLISVSFGADRGVVYEGQDIKVYRDIKKIDFRPIVNNLVTQSSDKILSSAMGANLYSDMFHNDAAHVRTMQKGRPFMKNVFLDCGRKFFSVANIKRVIDMMATVDLRNLVLDYSNHQGFRFALDDMTVTTSDGITYDISQGLSADYLSQSDMDELISYAKNKNVNIIGGLNFPGHAMALLKPIFNTSGIDLDSETQQQFAAAVTEKYATYFESKGAAYYYLGGDESGKHAKYGFFMNRMMHIILKHNMIPLIWNDQICRSDQGGINKPYINDGAICMFWGANNQGAQTIERNNFQQINSSMSIYWVLGPNSGKVTIEKMNQFNINVFHGNATVRKNIVGAQFCMWMDGAGGVEDLDNDGTDVINKCLPLIEAFGNTIMNQTGIARISTYRPANPTAGDFFFDTTINKPIWYNGTNWVDSIGTNV